MSVYRNHPGAYELDTAPNPLTGEKWGGYYFRHVGALTEEDMHSKAEIAAELAHRDLQIDNLRAELAAKTDWRPIATAPTDRWVLVWRPHSTVPFLARYDAEYAAFEDTFGDHVYHATHWMPLPLPPEESK